MNIEKAKIIFMGTSLFAKEVLNILKENNIDIRLVVTRIDRPSGRKMKLRASEVKKYAIKNNLKLKQFKKLDEEALDEIKKIKPDVVVVVSYGLLIPEKFLTIPKFGFVNIHPSLLPKLRGPSPIQTAILKGFKETGLTLMKIDSGMDSGDIIKQEKTKITEDETCSQLENRFIKQIQNSLVNWLNLYLQGKVKIKKQDSSKASFSKIINKRDGQVNWKKENTDEIYNKFKAFYEWPQVYTFWNTKKGLKKIILSEVLKGESKKKQKRKPGQVFAIGKKIFIKTIDGALELKEVQIEGKGKMNIKAFLNGNSSFINSILI